MIDKLKLIEQRFEELGKLLILPETISNQAKYIKFSKEYKDLQKIIDKGKTYKILLSNKKEAQEIISTEKDSEMIEMAKLQLEEVENKMPKIEEELKFLLIPKDPDDSKNVVVEIRAGTGGDEASFQNQRIGQLTLLILMKEPQVVLRKLFLRLTEKTFMPA